MLHQPLGFFDDHLGHLHMAFGRLVKGGADHFSFYRPLHVRDFFRALVDEQDKQHDVLVIFHDAVGNALQQHGLTGPGRRHNQPALAEADGRQQVHDPRGVVFRIGFQVDLVFRVQRRQVVEKDLLPGHFRIFIVDRLHLQQGEVALGFLGLADLPGNGVTGPEVEPPDLRR